MITSNRFLGGIFLAPGPSCMYSSVTAVMKLATNCGAVVASERSEAWLDVFRKKWSLIMFSTSCSDWEDEQPICWSHTPTARRT